MGATKSLSHLPTTTLNTAIFEFCRVSCALVADHGRVIGLMTSAIGLPRLASKIHLIDKNLPWLDKFEDLFKVVKLVEGVWKCPPSLLKTAQAGRSWLYGGKNAVQVLLKANGCISPLRDVGEICLMYGVWVMPGGQTLKTLSGFAPLVSGIEKFFEQTTKINKANLEPSRVTLDSNKAETELNSHYLKLAGSVASISLGFFLALQTLAKQGALPQVAALLFPYNPMLGVAIIISGIIATIFTVAEFYYSHWNEKSLPSSTTPQSNLPIPPSPDSPLDGSCGSPAAFSPFPYDSSTLIATKA